MKGLELAFFALATLLILGGGIVTVAAKNPIRGAMGLLTTIIGIAGMYLGLFAEFLAAIQIIVYAGAVVVLFIFVIMLLGPSAASGKDARGAIARYTAASLFVGGAALALLFMRRAFTEPVGAFPPAPPRLGTIEGIGRELYTQTIVPFELSGALLLVAVVGAVAVARGKQVDPTLLPATEKGEAARDEARPSQKPARKPMTAAAKEGTS